MMETPPLEGIRVVELAQLIAAPSAGLLLAEYGASVVKIEPPAGDAGRTLRSAAAAHLPESPAFTAYNRNKSSVRLDLRTDEARTRALDLIDTADVLITSSRPGAMNRLGLGWDDLSARNPGLVYAAVTGFGNGPVGRDRGGVDIVVQAESGIMSVTGYPDLPPVKVGFTVVDAACGHALCHGILAALVRRQRTGRGSRVDLSLFDVAVHLQTGPFVEYLMTGSQPGRSGNAAPMTAPADLYRCQDGEIVVSAYLDLHWRRFIDALGVPELADDPRFVDGSSRSANHVELKRIIEGALAMRGTDKWIALLIEAKLLVAKVKNYEALASDENVVESHLIQRFDGGFGIRNPVMLAGTESVPPAALMESL
jgi:crotonobetainyl-CoA:carnitine CoA-transferase CaiB-like acyl-CoA transferase